MSVLNILCLILWLVVVPFCMGLLFFPLVGKSFRTPAMALTAGYILLFMLLELIGIPVVLPAVKNRFTGNWEKSIRYIVQLAAIRLWC